MKIKDIIERLEQIKFDLETQIKGFSSCVNTNQLWGIRDEISGLQIDLSNALENLTKRTEAGIAAKQPYDETEDYEI